jgi:hypothetical protein
MADVGGPGERIELPERQRDQHDERQDDEGEGLVVLHDIDLLTGSSPDNAAVTERSLRRYGRYKFPRVCISRDFRAAR